MSNETHPTGILVSLKLRPVEQARPGILLP